MPNLLERIALAAVTVLVLAHPCEAGDLVLEFGRGRVTLIADNVPTGEILSRWAARGNTRIVDIAQLAGPVVTLELRDVPERVVLEILLRPFAGHVASMRDRYASGESAFDRIMILPASRPPVSTPASAAVAVEPPLTTDFDVERIEGALERPGGESAAREPVRSVGVAPATTGFQPAATGTGPPLARPGSPGPQRGVSAGPGAVPQPAVISPFNSTGQSSTMPTMTAAPYPSSMPLPPPPVEP